MIIYIQNSDFNWNRFEYQSLSDISKELKASKIKIGDSCELGDSCKLGNYCKLGDSADVTNSTAIFILNGYKYSAGGYFNKKKEQMIQLGCFLHTRKEWDSNFWNNLAEFPNDGSETSEARLKVFKTVCLFLDSIKL